MVHSSPLGPSSSSGIRQNSGGCQNQNSGTSRSGIRQNSGARRIQNSGEFCYIKAVGLVLPALALLVSAG